MLALMAAPVIDSFGQYVCSPGVNSDFYCLFTQNGQIGWSENTESQILVSPRIWEDSTGSVIYTVESLYGRISQFDLYSGEILWQFNCADIGSFDDICQASVEAEFAIAPSGNIIYYGDIFGRITSLEIATFQTDAPTISPTSLETSSPTQEPTGSRIASNSPSVGVKVPKPVVPVGTGSTVASLSPSAAVEVPEPVEVAESDSPASDSLNADKQSQKQERDYLANLAIYIGAAIGGFCILVVFIVVLCLLRRANNKALKEKEVVVEIIGDCDNRNISGSRDLENPSDAFVSDAIEIEYMGSKAVATTPSRRKKKRRKRSPQAQTPQTTTTLESIEEIEEEAGGATGNQNGRREAKFKGENLSHRFSMADREMSSSSSTSQSSGDERNISPLIAPGGVGIALLTNHIELAVGPNGNCDLSPLFPAHGDSLLFPTHGGSSDSEDASDNSDASDLTPPPPPSTLTSSTVQWSWGKLMNFANSTSYKEKQFTNSDKSSSISNEQVILRAVTQDEPFPVEDSGISKVASADDVVSHRAETPTASNHGKVLPSSPDSPGHESECLQVSSPASWLGFEDIEMSPVPYLGSSSDEPNNEEKKPEISSSAIAQEVNMVNVEDEKKDNEETYSLSPCPVFGRQNVLSSPKNFTNGNLETSSPVSQMSEHQKGSAFSPNEHSHSADFINSPITPVRSPSNFSTDDSMYTSATGAPDEKARESSNVSPLSTNLFDREIYQNDRLEIPDDESRGAFSPPELTASKIDKFIYLDEEEDVGPDDEVTKVPGFQYMINKPGVNAGEKYGRSVRSKSDNSTSLNKLPKQNPFGSGRESPLASIYKQLAITRKKQTEEKKHSFKRRSKKAPRTGAFEPDPDSEQQEGDDTWGSFLQELADAEKQFFSPPTPQSSSLLNLCESHDSEDSEVARINTPI
jgi:hypothetical protein